MSYCGAASETFVMGGDLNGLLSPKRKRSSRSTASKKNNASHQPNTTQLLDNISSPLSSPAGSYDNSTISSSSRLGGLVLTKQPRELRCNVSFTDDDSRIQSKLSSENYMQGSSTPPSSSSSGLNSRSLLSMVYQSVGKGRASPDAAQVISPSPESSPDSFICRGLIVGKCDFDSAADCDVGSLECERQTSSRINNVSHLKADSSPSKRPLKSFVKLSTKENYESAVQSPKGARSSFIKRHHSFTCPGSENLRPLNNDWFSSFEGESDDETKSSVNSFISRSSKSISRGSTFLGGSCRNSDDDRSFNNASEGNDFECRLSALHMGLGRKPNSNSRSVFFREEDLSLSGSGSKCVSLAEKDDSLRGYGGDTDRGDESTFCLDTLLAADRELGGIPENDPESPDHGDFIKREVHPHVNYVTAEHFIGRVGATLVVRGNPFSNTEYSSPLVYVDSTRTAADRMDLAEAAHDLSPVWHSPQDQDVSDCTENVRFPYDTSTSTLHTPVRSEAEKHMGDLGTPVTEVGSPAVIDMDAYVAADEVDGGFSQKSLFMRVKDLDPWSARKGKKEEKCFNFAKLIHDDVEIPGPSSVNPYGYGLFQSLSDLPTQTDDGNNSNISHITVESTAMSRTHNTQQLQHGLDGERRNEGSTVPESVRTRSQLDRLFQCNFNETNTSFSSECSSLHLYPNGRPSQAHSKTQTHSTGRPLPDQTAFDRGLCSPRNTSPVLLTATPSRPCPATPMRTPSWGADRGALDSEDQFSERSSSSSMSQIAHTKISSLTQNKVFISLSDSISTADVSFHRDFVHEGFLGAGSFAEVYMAREKDGRVYAVKKNKKPFRSIKDRNILIDEVTIMKKLGESPCVHLLRLIRAWQEDGYFFVQIELAERGTLRDLLTATAASGKTLSECTVWHIAHDVSKGLQHVHNCGIVHLDVKPANLLISEDGTIKIGDFGTAVESGQEADGKEGDDMYIAPELLAAAYRYPSADIFSLGLTLYEVCIISEHRERLAAGQSAFPPNGPDWQVLRHGQASPLPSEYSNALRKLISSAMERVASSRPTTDHILSLPEVLVASSSQDPTLRAATSSTGRTSTDTQVVSRFNRSASFNPSMNQAMSMCPPVLGPMRPRGLKNQTQPLTGGKGREGQILYADTLCTGDDGTVIPVPTGVCDASGTVRSWRAIQPSVLEMDRKGESSRVWSGDVYEEDHPLRFMSSSTAATSTESMGTRKGSPGGIGSEAPFISL